MEKQLDPREVAKLIAETFTHIAACASDVAYARRTLYNAYISEGFTPEQALELCKVI